MKHILDYFRSSIPFSRLISIAIALSFGIQFILVSYNYATGFILHFTFIGFMFRLFYGAFLNSFIGLPILLINILLINNLNARYPWNSTALKRVLLQFIFTLLIAVLFSSLITMVANALNPYPEGIQQRLIGNALITIVINLLLMVTLEAWMLYRDGKNARYKAETLEKELTGIKFEVLKNQLNPHFMFNSLNVLSGLIDKDTGKAQLFIDAFASIYRYVLDTIDKQVVVVSEEMNFVKSYIFLQQIRHGSDLRFQVKISSDKLNQIIPPLSLQLLLENAIKHNLIDKGSPLFIEIFCENDFLVVKNNYQPKLYKSKSTGIGLANLSKRYSMISEIQPTFELENNYYVARIPLLISE